MAENGKKQRKTERQCQNVKPPAGSSGCRSQWRHEASPGGGVRFVNDFPGLQLSVTLGEAGFIYAAHAVGYEKDKPAAKKPHHAICIRSPCLGRLKREVLSLE